MQYKPWVRRFVTEISGIFNLHEWKIELCWEDDYPHDDPEHNTVMFVDTDSDYLKAWVHVTPRGEELWDEGRIDILSESIIHEFVHILTDPVYKFAHAAASEITLPFLTNKNEQTTQKITRIVMALLPKKIFSLRK